jgi:acyl carrier protein
VRLDVAAAFHTPSVAWAEAPWRAALAQAAFAPPAFPVYADGAAQPYPVDPDAAREALARQPFEPVRFDALLRRMYDDGVRLFVEVGPGTALTGMVARALGDDALAVPLLPDSQPDALDQALLRLLVAGVPVRPQHEAPPPPRPRSAATVQLAGPHLVPPSRRAALEGALSSPLSPLVPAAGHVERPGAAPDLAALVPAGGPATRPNLAPVERPSAPDLVQDLELATLAAHERYLQVELSHTALLTELAARGDDALLLRLQAHQEALHSTHRALPGGPARPGGAAVRRALGAAPSDGVGPPSPPGPRPRRAASRPFRRYMLRPSRRVPSRRRSRPRRRALQRRPSSRCATRCTPCCQSRRATRPRSSCPGWTWRPTSASTPSSGWRSWARPGGSSGLAEVPRGLRDARSLGEVLDALAAATAPSPASPSPAGPSARDLLFELVAERTGYPAEVLLPEMDLEADLGIDSIKRVAILGAAGQKLGLAEVPRGLRDARSLGEVLDALTAAMAPPAAPRRPLRPRPAAGDRGGAHRLPGRGAAARDGPGGRPRDRLHQARRPAGRGRQAAGAERSGGPRPPARAAHPRRGARAVHVARALRAAAPGHRRRAPRPAAAPGTSVTPLSAPRPNSGALPRSPTPPRATSTLPTRRLLRLEPLPPPRPLPRVLPDRHHVLVVSDDAAALAALVAALAARELPLVAMWAGDDEAPELPEWVDWVTLPGRDEVALQRTLDWVHHNLGPTAALLLAPTAAAHDRRWLGLALLLVRFLQPALQASAGAVVLGVRLDGALGRRGSPRALAAGLLGLTRTLRHELPEVSSRLVDLGPRGAGGAARARAARRRPQRGPRGLRRRPARRPPLRRRAA